MDCAMLNIDGSILVDSGRELDLVVFYEMEMTLKSWGSMDGLPNQKCSWRKCFYSQRIATC